MEPLDGNVIAGALLEAFGAEMTAAGGTCAHCETVSRIAELVVYAAGPGMVARCPTCAGVVMVVVEIRGRTQVHRGGLQSIDPPGSD
jgi:Family of unknown function (DUF6510)